MLLKVFWRCLCFDGDSHNLQIAQIVVAQQQ